MMKAVKQLLQGTGTAFAIRVARERTMREGKEEESGRERGEEGCTLGSICLSGLVEGGKRERRRRRGGMESRLGLHRFGLSSVLP